MNAKRQSILAMLLLCLVSALPAVGAQDPAPAQPPTQAQPTAAPAQPAAQPPATVAPAQTNPNVSVNVTRTEETQWYLNPVLIGLGVLVLVVLVVLASRGEPSTTTIVKD